jgi:hypothetical protein
LKRRYFNYQFESNGSAAVALYSIPLKLTELQQIPLRVLLQRHSQDVKASLHNQIDEVKAYSIPIQVL